MSSCRVPGRQVGVKRRTLRIHCLKHVPFEGPAKISTWAQARGHSLEGTELFKGQPLPSPEDFDFLVVMGGPMSVQDEAQYAWLPKEKKLIERALAAGKLVLGVCLGAQLLADVLGAKVYKNKYREIGWFPVRVSPGAARSGIFHRLPESLNAFHWHGETFDLPSGAIHLAESSACQNQAFAFRRNAIGLQFHLEVTRASVTDLIENCRGEIGAGPFEQSAESMLASGKEFAALEPILYDVLDEFAGRDSTPTLSN